jgi:hypothetical protein
VLRITQRHPDCTASESGFSTRKRDRVISYAISAFFARISGQGGA